MTPNVRSLVGSTFLVNYNPEDIATSVLAAITVTIIVFGYIAYLYTKS